MALAEPLAGLSPTQAAPSTELADQWRRLTRAATAVAVLTSPALFIWFKEHNGWGTLASLAATVGVVIVFRGFADLFFRRLIPWPSLFGADSPRLREEDVMGRRRAWYWRKKARVAAILGTVITVVWLIRGGSWLGTRTAILSGLGSAFSNPAVLTQIVFVTFLFIANFAILMGPMLLMGISQRRDEVADELRRPLTQLLPSQAPRAGALGEIELGNVLRLTQPRTYDFQFQAASDGKPVLILTPPAVGS